MSDSSASATINHRAEASSLLHKGVSACRRRRFDEAAAAFEAGIAAAPTDGGAWLMLARCQALAGVTGKARLSCEKALALDPTQLRGHLLVARLAARAEDGRLRISALKEAVALRPSAVGMRLTLVSLMLRRIQHKAAMVVAKEALDLAPDDPRVMLTVARCHMALGQLAKAESLLERSGQSPGLEAERNRIRDDLALRRGRPPIPDAGPEIGGLPVVPTAIAAISRPVEPAEPVAILPLSPTMGRPRHRAAERRGSADVEGQVEPQVLRAIERSRRGPGFVDHLLILRALILRDLRLRHRDSGIGVLVDLVRPSIVVFVHYWMFYLLHKPMPGQIPIEAYVLAGFSVWFAFNGTWIGAGTGAKWPAGAASLPGVTELHLRVAKAAWPLLLNLVFCLLALIPLRLIGRDLPLANVPETCLIFVMAGLSGFGLGLLLERLSQIVPLIKTVEKLLTWALFITSGLYFSLETTPPVLAYWFWYNPLLHLIEYERHAFDSGYPVALLDLSYPAVFMVGLLVMGLLVYGSIRCPAHD